MFTTGKVIDIDRIEESISAKNTLTIDMLKSTLSNGMFAEEENIYDVYLSTFSTLFCDFTLDELEYIDNNNLCNFDRNNLLDYKCQKIISNRINEYRKTINDLVGSINSDGIGAYFQRFGSLLGQAKKALDINMMLGLDRPGVILTPYGIKLKHCIDNLQRMYVDFLVGSKEAIASKR